MKFGGEISNSGSRTSALFQKSRPRLVASSIDSTVLLLKGSFPALVFFIFIFCLLRPSACKNAWCTTVFWCTQPFILYSIRIFTEYQCIVSQPLLSIFGKSSWHALKVCWESWWVRGEDDMLSAVGNQIGSGRVSGGEVWWADRARRSRLSDTAVI